MPAPGGSQVEAELQPAVRLDFLLTADGRAHTLEITELGFSMWGWDSHGP